MRLLLTADQLRRWRRANEGRIRVDDQGLSLKEAAHQLGVSDRAVYVWIRDGRLPAVKLGTRWIIRASVVDRLLREGLPQREDTSSENKRDG